MPRASHPLAWSSRFLAVAVVLAGARAHAACTLSACSAAPIIAACCTASSCTIDGTITASGPSCSFDFGTRSVAVTLSGHVVAQGSAVTLTVGSLDVAGSIDVRGMNGADGGSATIVTDGATALAYNQHGGLGAGIDASSSAGNGGTITIQADGPVALSNGQLHADGGTGKAGGIVTVTTSSGGITQQVLVTALSQVPPTGALGTVSFVVPGDVTIGGNARILADYGTINVTAGGTASFAAGSVLRANQAGSVNVTAGTIQGSGAIAAGGDGGSIALEATTGPFSWSMLSGLTVSTDGDLSVMTDAAAPIALDTPIIANGADVEITSGGDLEISKKVDVTGIIDPLDGTSQGGGSVSLEVAGNLQVTSTIDGSDPSFADDMSIDAGGDVTIAGPLFTKGLAALNPPNADGGNITITAGGSIDLQGDFQLNTSGAGVSSAGDIELDASRNLLIEPSYQLVANGSPTGYAGSFFLDAGVDEVGAERLPGNLTLQGDLQAHGNTAVLNVVEMTGCNVTIAAGSLTDVTGTPPSTITVTARTGLTIAGTLKDSGSTTLIFAQGTTPSITGALSPAPSAGVCAGGTAGANGCAQPPCTGTGDSPSCLAPCPSCGDGHVDFPETCDSGSTTPSCNGLDHCDQYCRQVHCDDGNPCTTDGCDAVNGCERTAVADGISCDDNNPCNGQGVCASGACVAKPGSIPTCDDQNPCTIDSCDPVLGCTHTNDAGPHQDGTGVAGCDDGNPCDGKETCVNEQCMPGTPPCTGQTPVCDPATGQCSALPGACTTAADCDDGNPCTDDVCSNATHTCSNPLHAAGFPCGGDFCSGFRTCTAGGVCQVGTPPTCDDNDACTIDGCTAGACQHAGIPNCCQTSLDCNDNNLCTNDACVGGTCQHTAITCDDNNPCTTDTCGPAAGCQHNQLDPNCHLCRAVGDCPDDPNVCKDKACVGGLCVYTPSPVCCTTGADCQNDPDHNPCTDNGSTCTANRCISTPLSGVACGTSCDPATCQGGTCVPDAPKDCNDNNPCTADVCTDAGCTHAPIADCCQTTLDCNDNNACTDDSCDLQAGRCDHATPDPTCVPCTGADPIACGPRCQNTCVSGRCEAVPPDCDDNNPCTTDSCDPNTGCTHTAADGATAAPCDDHDPCTDGDTTCDAAGTCQGVARTGFAAVDCRIADVRQMLDTADAGAVKARFRTHLDKLLAKLTKKSGAAQTPGGKCAKEKRLTGALATQIRAIQKAVNRTAGKQIDADLATSLALRLGEAATSADQVRAALAC